MGDQPKKIFIVGPGIFLKLCDPVGNRAHFSFVTLDNPFFVSSCSDINTLGRNIKRYKAKHLGYIPK